MLSILVGEARPPHHYYNAELNGAYYANAKNAATYYNTEHTVVASLRLYS